MRWMGCPPCACEGSPGVGALAELGPRPVSTAMDEAGGGGGGCAAAAGGGAG
jgi:hypothetical protein